MTLSSWSSLEVDEPANQGGQSVSKSKALLRGKIQAGVLGRVNNFWKEKVGQ